MDQKQKLEMLKELFATATPLTNEAYFYVTWLDSHKCYVNLALSPLYRDFVISIPTLIDIDFGEHRFKVMCDQCIYLVLYDEALAQFKVGESFIIKNKVDTRMLHTFYFGFNPKIESRFVGKIESNHLYWKSEAGNWKEAKL